MKAIELRPARWEDKAAIAALSAQIWDGEDYLADCFDDWTRDSEGQFTLAMAEDELAACNKLTRLAAQEWWLEGLRVDPRFRRTGLARLLHDYALELIRKKGGGQVRMTTACDNPAVLKIATKTGFAQQNSYLIARFTLATAVAPAQFTATRFVPVAANDLPHFQERLTASDAFAAQGGLLEDGWVWYEILPRLPQLQRDGRLFWHSGSDGALIANVEDGEPLAVNFVAAEEKELTAVVADLPYLAAHFQCADIRYKPADTAVNRAALQENGWDIDEETLCLFEYTV
jgi:GNAT superfamily N-acetyltransferase